MQLDHINIKAPRDLLEQVRDFYCAVLGMQQGFRPNFSSTGYWLYADDRPLVHLSLGSGAPGSGGPGHLDHVAFRAEGLQAFLGRLDGLEISYHTSHLPELNLTQLFFKDPAGIGLEINFAGEKMP